jgi:hypothetical protein
MEKIAALQAVQMAQAPGPVGAVGNTNPSPNLGGDPGRSAFDAAMRAAEMRADQSFEVLPQASGKLTSPDIGTGLQNVLKGFSDYHTTHMGPDLQRVLNADPLDPKFSIDSAAYAINSTVANLQFTVAAKMAAQLSKNLDTLFKSS